MMFKIKFLFFYFVMNSLLFSIENKYGILVNGGVAPLNPIMQQKFAMNLNGEVIINNLDLGQAFLSLILCDGLTDQQYLKNCSNNINSLADNKDLFTFDNNTSVQNFIENSTQNSGVVGAKFDYIEYTSPGYSSTNSIANLPTENLSGLVVLPTDGKGNILPVSKIKGILIYYHGTIPSKNGVPSGLNNQDSVDFFQTFIYQYIVSSIFVSSGYIVISPDYIGQGMDFKTMHPYAFETTQNALSGIYMLKATNEYLLSKYNFGFKDMINNKLFISSYSEGGGYALKATKILDSNQDIILNKLNLKLVKTYGVSGAYDVSNTMIDFMYDNVDTNYNDNINKWNAIPGCAQSGPDLCINEANGQDLAVVKYYTANAKPVLSIFLATSFNYYYNEVLPLSNFLDADVITLQSCIDLNNSLTQNQWLRVNCNTLFGQFNTVTDLFMSPKVDAMQVSLELNSVAMANKFLIGPSSNFNNLSQLLAISGNNYNSVLYFSPKTGVISPIFQKVVQKGNSYHFTTTTPVEILSLRYDSEVPNRNSEIACDNLKGIHVSGNGSISCKQLDNTKMWSMNSYFGNNYVSYLIHEDAEPIFDIHEVQDMNNY